MSDSDARLFAQLVGQILDDRLAKHEQVVANMARSVNEGLQAMLESEERANARIDALAERVEKLEKLHVSALMALLVRKGG
jgi:hypothetical protein